jgi:hypothetical protein
MERNRTGEPEAEERDGGRERVRAADAGGRKRSPAERPLQSERIRGAAASREICPRCGRPAARVIGRSESFPVLYLQCSDCGQTSVAPA